MVFVDTVGAIWVCTTSYDPSGPTNAVWVDIASFSITVNTGPVQSRSINSLPITSQPLVSLGVDAGQLQPLPPLFGFSFPGTTPRLVHLGDSVVPGEICAGPDGNLWVCDTNSSAPGVWKVTPDGVATNVLLDTGSIPSGICASGPYVWVTDSGHGSFWVIGVNDDSTNEFGNTSGATPGLCCTGPDGNVWAIDPIGTGGGVGGVWNVTGTPQATAPIFYPVGTSSTVLSGICAGPDGNVWASGSDDGSFWQITPAGVSTAVISGDFNAWV